MSSGQRFFKQLRLSRVCAALAVAASAASAACDVPPVDVHHGAETTSVYPGEECRVAFVASEWPACDPDFASASARACTRARLTVGPWGDALIRYEDWGTYNAGAYACFYDRETQQLTGAWRMEDVPFACGGASYTQAAGSAPVGLTSGFVSAATACLPSP